MLVYYPLDDWICPYPSSPKISLKRISKNISISFYLLETIYVASQLKLELEVVPEPELVLELLLGGSIATQSKDTVIDISPDQT